MITNAYIEQHAEYITIETTDCAPNESPNFEVSIYNHEGTTYYRHTFRFAEVWTLRNILNRMFEGFPPKECNYIAFSGEEFHNQDRYGNPAVLPEDIGDRMESEHDADARQSDTEDWPCRV